MGLRVRGARQLDSPQLSDAEVEGVTDEKAASIVQSPSNFTLHYSSSHGYSAELRGWPLSST